MSLPSHRRFQECTLGLRFGHVSGEGRDDTAHNFVLNRIDVLELAIVALRPPVGTSHCINELSADADGPTAVANAAFQHVAHAQFATDLAHVYRLPLYWKLELRAMTNSSLNRDSSVMMSSTMPSAKYS